jgi:hypothetical protein
MAGVDRDILAGRAIVAVDWPAAVKIGSGLNGIAGILIALAGRASPPLAVVGRARQKLAVRLVRRRGEPDNPERSFIVVIARKPQRLGVTLKGCASLGWLKKPSPGRNGRMAR